jgi:cytosine/adenosine deaminase-related metal-dependent hydrolase
MIEPIVFLGRLVTFDDGQVIDDGALYIGADETIAAVQKASDPAPEGFGGARRVKTGGAIYPGLIDLHGHMVYNCLSLWSPAGRTEPYVSRYEWPGAHDYEARISDPANALGAMAGKALLKYVEVKAVVGGTTAVQGSAKMAYPYEGWLVRNVEYETFKTKKKSVFQSALPLKNDDEYKKEKEKMEAGSAFLYHLSEGTDTDLIDEYAKLREEKCLLPRLGAIHCTALEKANFDQWGSKGSAVIWSPFSNLWLYRETTKVDEATAAGLRVCLGADWSPSGSKNLLGELKVADVWNKKHPKKKFSDEQLCEMATCNPADALGWGDRLGRLKVGLQGDILVTTDRDKSNPYRNLIESIERDVLLVAINGQPFYGTTALITATGAANAESIQVGRLRRKVILVYPGVKDADMGWKEATEDIEKAKEDPVKRYLEIKELHEVGKPPPWLMTDKPWDDPSHTGKEIPVTVEIPPLDALNHNSAYFKAIAASPLHGGELDPIEDYYDA